MFLSLNTSMDWIIKSTVKLDAILPIVDQLTNTLDKFKYQNHSGTGGYFTNSSGIRLRRSTRGPGGQQWELHGCREQGFQDLVMALKQKVKDEFNKKFDKDIVLSCVGAWTVKGQEHSYHTLHHHHRRYANRPESAPKGGKNFISVVTYLHVPKRRWDGDGAFYFAQLEDGILVAHHLDPEPGTFVIMPSNMLHGAYPQPAGLRQTLNLDFEWKLDDKE